MKKIGLLLFALLAVFASAAFAHQTDFPHDEAILNPGSGLSETMAAAFGLILAIGVASAVLGEKLGRLGKKAAFAAIVAISGIATLYLVASVVALFTSSATGGPVHWHADFEVWACGDKISLKQAGGWTTRVGPLLLHHHGDDRMHVEGIVRELQDVSLKEFFKAIGGGFTRGELLLIDSQGLLRHWNNGEACPDGSAGTLKMLVNGKPNSEFGNYVIAPYADVPPGDVIKIVFGSTP